MPSWKRIVVSGSDATLNTLTVSNGITGSLFGTASYALTANNGGVTKIIAGANVNLSPVNGLGDVTVTSFGTNLYNTATGSYGSFYDTGSVVANSATAIYSMSLNTTDISNGVFISASNGDNTRVKFTNAGTYSVQFSSQFSNTDNSNQDVVIWIRKNGVDIPDSSGVSAAPPFKAGSNGQVIATWNYYLSLSAGDYIQMCWHAKQANVITLETIAAGTSPTHPRTPSTILTAQRVDTFLSNTGSFSGSFTGILTGTASYATQALSASFAPSTPTFPFTGSAIITGSLNVIGNTTITGSLNITGSSTITNGALILSSSATSTYVLRTAGDSVAMLDNYGLAGRSYLRIGTNGIFIHNAGGDPTIGCAIGMNLNSSATIYSSATSHIFYGGTNKQVSIGTAAVPTAKLHIAAGAAAATSAPIKLTAGTNMTTPEAGTIEFDGNSLFFTTGSTRSTILTNISPASITGNLVVTGSLLVSGSVRLNGNSGVNITGNTQITGSLLVSGSSLVAGITPIPLAGTIQDGVTSVLGSLNDWNSNFYQGTVLYSETAGGTITFGQLCYRTQNETWELADATAANSAAAFNMLGICVKSSTSTNPTSILINGFVETATYATIVKSGEPLYMAITPGSMTKTAPTTVGNAVRIIGNTFWDSNTNAKIIIRFNPENSWIEL